MTSISIHRFTSTGEAYDASQCDDNIKDGDILVVESERVVGILVGAWPTAVTPERGAFHTFAEDADLTCIGKAEERTVSYTICPDDAPRYEHTEVIPADPGTDYTASVALAQETAATLGQPTDAEIDAWNEGGPQDPADQFGIGSPVVLLHPFSGTPRGRGHVVGQTQGFYDFGSPESGPGPVEEVALCVIRLLDGSLVNAYPGDMQDDEAGRPLKWTAEVSVAGQDFTSMIDYPASDTLGEVKKAAVKLASYLIGQEIGSDAAVTVFKQLAGEERKRDRAFYVYRDDSGAIKVQA